MLFILVVYQRKGCYHAKDEKIGHHLWEWTLHAVDLRAYNCWRIIDTYLKPPINHISLWISDFAYPPFLFTYAIKNYNLISSILKLKK